MATHTQQSYKRTPGDTSPEAVKQFGDWLYHQVDALPPVQRAAQLRTINWLLDLGIAHYTQRIAAAASSRVTVTEIVPELPSGMS